MEISRSKPMRSAIGETWLNPRKDANLPLVAIPPSDNIGSCGWAMIKAPNDFAYTIARASTLVFCTTRYPSENATAPASCRNPISVISRPARPLVRAAMCRTFTGETSAARRRMNSNDSGVSIAGSVSARVTIVVTPPAAAAAPAVL